MTRPRLLFLCQTLPYPPDGGVAIRTFNVLRLLAERFDVTALCFYRWKRGAVLADPQPSVEALRQYADVRAFPIPSEHSRARLVWDHARSVVTGRVYTRFVYRSPGFASALAERVRDQRFDLAHVDSIDLAEYLDMLPGDLPVALVHHNVESILLRRRGDVERSAISARYLRHQAALLEREERRRVPRASLNVMVSEDDERRMRELAPDARYAVVPNGVDVEFFTPGDGNGEGIVFVGGTTWFPNRDALEYFASEILPLIRRERHDLRVTWVGRASDAERRRFADLGITLTGYVEDIRPSVRRAACYVVPLRVGGGTRLKILDAWAMGMPLVTTSIGCEGLDADHGRNALVADTPAAFAQSVLQVLEDRDLRRRLGHAARRTAVEKYSWSVIGRSMASDYSELVGPAGASPRGEPCPSV